MSENIAATVTRDGYREAMARLGAAVNVITTDGPGGRFGFTASAVCSVTDTPPTLLVCVNRTNDSHDPLVVNGVLCVNTLTHGQAALSPVFAGMNGMDRHADRFGHGAWDRLATGAPVLLDAAVSFDCRVTQRVDVGTHSVLFCNVEAIRLGPTHEGLIYYGRHYHRVAPP
jgi:flavin reductase